MDLLETVKGEGPSPFFILLMVRALPDTSAYKGLARGGWEFVGWGIDQEIAASTYDAMNVNTRATGNWKRPPTIPAFPRPVKAEKKKLSVRSLYASFQKGLGK